MTKTLHPTIWIILLAVVEFCFSGFLLGETLGPENGILYIHGGGAFNASEFINLAKQASGKDQPVIRVITTPQGKRRENDYKKGIPFRLVTTLKERFGLDQVTELFTLSKEEADSPDFYQQIDNADAIHMSGGNQCYLTDTFLGTKTLAAMYRLLERGGVISGSSAGAQVQSSFMTRGDYTQRSILGDKEHQEGFSFIKNSAFDVHVEERGRENDLFLLFQAKESQLQNRDLNPHELLGIGIDQNTAITVIKNHLQVSGQGQVYIFDPNLWDDDPNQWSLQTLKPGTCFDMKARKVIGR